MDLSIFLAKMVGIWMIVAGMALIRNHEGIRGMVKHLTKDYMTLFISGLFALLIGMLMVLTHNIWFFGWPVIITIIGWIALIKGIVLMVFPDTLKDFAEWYLNKISLRLFGVFYLLLGLFFCWKGFLPA